MSKISDAFKSKALITHIMAGDPTAEKTGEYMLALEESGADMIMIGIPFSDPVADGEVLQRAHIRALENGIRVSEIFDTIESVSDKINVPILLFTYMNPVFKFGYDNFLKRCKEARVSGLVIPDLPFEGRGEITEHSDKYGIELIYFAAPGVKARNAKNLKDSSGFIYAIPYKSDDVLIELLADVKEVCATPRVVPMDGCNLDNVIPYCDGVIVSGAIVEILEKNGANVLEEVKACLSEIKKKLV